MTCCTPTTHHRRAKPTRTSRSPRAPCHRECIDRLRHAVTLVLWWRVQVGHGSGALSQKNLHPISPIELHAHT
eukprot:5136610-Prymnesium_polylepis.1